MLKTNDFDRDRCRTFIVQFPCQNMKAFCLFESFRKKTGSRRPYGGEHCICFPAQEILTLSLYVCLDNISYLLQSLNKESLLYKILYFNFCILPASNSA